MEVEVLTIWCENVTAHHFRDQHRQVQGVYIKLQPNINPLACHMLIRVCHIRANQRGERTLPNHHIGLYVALGEEVPLVSVAMESDFLFSTCRV